MRVRYDVPQTSQIQALTNRLNRCALLVFLAFSYAGLVTGCESTQVVTIKKNVKYHCKVLSIQIDTETHKLKEWKIDVAVSGHLMTIYVHSPSRDFFTPEEEIVGKTFVMEFLDEVTNPYFGRLNVSRE
jgi:hypothetical protein